MAYNPLMKRLKRITVAALFLYMALAFTSSGSVGYAGNRVEKIANGTYAVAGQYSWVVAIVVSSYPDNYSGYWCAGSLIRPDWVITAGHCIAHALKNGWNLDVVVGLSSLLANDGTRVHVSNYVLHPSYSESGDNDVGLLQLPTPVSPSITPVTLVGQTISGTLTPFGTTSTVLGWGATTSFSKSNVLQELSIPTVSNATCQTAYSQKAPGTVITDNMICAGVPDGKYDACVGDSGGPLLVSSVTASPVLIGAVSFGTGACGAGTYGVYSNFSQYTGWITQNTCTSAEIPASPVIKVGLSGTNVTISWPSIAGATGYRLYYAPYPNAGYVYSADLGTQNSLSAQLYSGANFYVAVQAYKQSCTGGFSNVEHFTIP
ncbi:MAG: serine protease [Nitrospirae bacterium]|nr:serine protease [Nitrospirota bacterium]